MTLEERLLERLIRQDQKEDRSRKSSVELLTEKTDNPNTKGIPVIMMASNVDRSNLLKLASLRPTLYVCPFSFSN